MPIIKWPKNVAGGRLMGSYQGLAEGDAEPDVIESFGCPEVYAHGALVLPFDGPDVEIVLYVSRRRSGTVDRYEVARIHMPITGFDKSLAAAITRWKGEGRH